LEDGGLHLGVACELVQVLQTGNADDLAEVELAQTRLPDLRWPSQW